MKEQLHRFLRGFGYAAKGVARAVREERNLRFELCAGAYVLLFAPFYRFDRTQWALLCVLIAGVLALELVNSAVERAVDRPSPAHWAAAGAAKDMAAGAVLVFCAGAAVCGVLLLWDRAAFARMGTFFAAHPAAIAALAASLAAAVRFVFGRRDSRNVPPR